jgi:glycosyltransferase involved in cell wall biosynthesis
MNLLILWSPLADYTLECFHALSMKKDINLYIIYQPVSSAAPFSDFDMSFFKWAKTYEKQQEPDLLKECESIEPDFILMASWNYPFYMKMARSFRKKGTHVLSCFDGQWEPTLKQRLGVLSSPFFLKPAIDNFFVPGDRQAKFARKLGYENPLTGYYCANTDRFTAVADKRPPGKFVFVGRLVESKGIRELIEAYVQYRQSSRNPWDLIVAGTGELRSLLESKEGVSLKGFVQPDDLPGVMSQATCLVLPSHSEPWGLVVHEATSAGLLVIASHKVGSSTWFVRDGINGRIVSNSVESIREALASVSSQSDASLQVMRENSRKLASLWTKNDWAGYVYNYLDLHKKQKN